MRNFDRLVSMRILLGRDRVSSLPTGNSMVMMVVVVVMVVTVATTMVVA